MSLLNAWVGDRRFLQFAAYDRDPVDRNLHGQLAPSPAETRTERPHMTIDDALSRFIAQLQADGRSDHTIRQYGRHIRLFGRWTRDVGHTGAVGDVSHEDVAAFLGATLAKTRPDGRPKTAATVNALRASLRGLFRYLHRAGYIGEDPTRLLRRARCGSPPPRGLSEAEWDQLLFVLANSNTPEGRRDSALFHVMHACGLRVGSVVALDVEDVDLVRGEIEVRSVKGDCPGRAFLGGPIRDHLRRYVGERVTGPLFPRRGGCRLTTRQVQRRLAYWCREAGIRQVGPHALRHSFALDLYRRTGDVLLVKEALGHRSISATMVYARADEDRLRAAMG